MTVLNINRDWGSPAYIVRLVTTSSFDEINSVGWLSSQSKNISEINNGMFEWEVNDTLLITTVTIQDDGTFISDDNIFYKLSSDFSSVIPLNIVYPNRQDITSFSGGGQADAVLLNLGINVVATTVSLGSVKLPLNILGNQVIVSNLSTTDEVSVYPFEGTRINSLSTNSPYTLAPENAVMFVGCTLTRWFTPNN